MSYNLGTTALADFAALMSNYGKNYTITRVAETTDSMGAVSAVSETTFTIIGLIQDISHKDRKIHDMGLAVPGSRKLYVPPQNSGSYEVKEGDIVTDQYSVQWRVTAILRQPYVNDTEVYRVCVIKGISTEGTA